MLSSILTGLLAATCLTAARVIDRNGPQNEARQSVAEYEGYMFAYFTGNTVDGEKIRFAASNGNNALDWAELNGGQPVLTSTKGATGLRDPFIIRSADGGTFYILATDLSIGSGTSWDAAVRTGSRYVLALNYASCFAFINILFADTLRYGNQTTLCPGQSSVTSLFHHQQLE